MVGSAHLMFCHSHNIHHDEFYYENCYQVSLTYQQMEGLSHIQIDHTNHLNTLVKSQVCITSILHQSIAEY